MLCSKKKCNKKIPQGEEIQIAGTIICQQCSQEPITNCYICDKEIYNDEPIHEISASWDEFSEKLIRCQLCYEIWLLIEAPKRKEFWKTIRWIGQQIAFLTAIFGIFALHKCPSNTSGIMNFIWIISVIVLQLLLFYLDLQISKIGGRNKFGIKKNNKIKEKIN